MEEGPNGGIKSRRSRNETEVTEQAELWKGGGSRRGGLLGRNRESTQRNSRSCCCVLRDSESLIPHNSCLGTLLTSLASAVYGVRIRPRLPSNYS